MSMADDVEAFSQSPADEQASGIRSSAVLKLAVFCPQRPVHPGAHARDVAEAYATPEQFQVPANSTVKDVKAKLEQDFPGGPLARGQTLLWHGRRLNDDEVLRRVVQGTQQSQMGYVLHLMCPTNMWKSSAVQVPASTPSRSSSTSAAGRLSALSASLTPSSPAYPPQYQSSAFFTPGSMHNMQPAFPPLQAMVDNTHPPAPMSSMSLSYYITSRMDGSEWMTFYTHFAALSSSQKADFIGRLSRAERYYATVLQLAVERQGRQMTVLGEEEIQKRRESGQIGMGFSSQSVKEMEESIEQLLDDLGCLTIVHAAASSAAEEFDAVENTQSQLLGGHTSSRIVHIAGYPFLLQIPAQFAVSAKERKEAAVRVRKYQAIQILLSSLLSRIHVFQSTSFPNPANGFQPPYPGGARDGYNNTGQGPPAPGIAMQQGMNRPNGLGAFGIGAQAAARLAGPGMPTARLAVVINLDEIMALAMPLLFLSVKLAFLIYIFGKHATTRKRIVMCVMAFAWVVWEGTSIHRRRRAAENRRQQQRAGDPRHPIPPNDRVQNGNVEQPAGPLNAPVALNPPLDLEGRPANRGPQNNTAEGAAHVQQQFMPPAVTQLQQRLQALGNQNEIRRRNRNGEGGVEDARRNGRPQGSSRSSSQRQPPSRLSPKYWLYSMAKVGLSAEAREMGLSRTALRTMQATNRQAAQNGTPLPPLPAQPSQTGMPSAMRAYQAQSLTLRRALRNLYIGLILFGGTLIPEVERLRKKALSRREKMLAELEHTRRQMHLISLQAELGRLEDQRQALGNNMVAGGGSSPSGTDEHRDDQSPESTSSPQSSAQPKPGPGSASLDSTALEGGQRPGGLGLGIDALQSSESDPELFDPPFRANDVRAALATSSSSSSTSSLKQAPRAEDSNPSTAETGAAAAASPQIRIQTEIGRPNNLLSPMHAAQRRGDNVNPATEEDYSAPPTPLLSPAMTEDDDERQNEGGDEDVGM